MTRKQLIAEWRKQAATCRLKAQYSAADAYDTCATELETMTAPVVASNRRSFRITKILNALAEHKNPMRMRDLAIAVDMKQDAAFAYVRRLIADGTIAKAAKGHYALVAA